MSQRNRPLVTAITCTFNRTRDLPHAVASVLAQDCGDFEYFVVGDGGEGIGEALAPFDDPRMTCMEFAENRGKPSCLNDALARARGKYIAYLDDDDRWYPHHLSTLARALESSDCGAAYSDLYETLLATRGGRRVVMAKHVSISRDFDRMFLFYFNHILHVSLMHRRDLLQKTGLYDTDLNILIDWDMTRRLAFFTDFLHVPVITGEFANPVDDDARISVKRRKDETAYIRNVLKIRAARPAKPWPKVADISIVFAPGVFDRTSCTRMRDLLVSTCHPYKLYIPTPSRELARVRNMEEIMHMPVEPVPFDGAPGAAALDFVLPRVEGDFVAWIGDGEGISFEREWVELPLAALMQEGADAAFIGKGPTPHVIAGAAVMRAARARFGEVDVVESLRLAGASLARSDSNGDLFVFDYMQARAEKAEREGDFMTAGAYYEALREEGLNPLWMASCLANTKYELEQFDAAATLCRQLNETRPTVQTLLLEARAHRAMGAPDRTLPLLTRAREILTSEEYA